MPDRSGIFAGDDPFDLARDWMAEATKTEPNDANAAALATVDETGMPNVRIVLIKAIEDHGFKFFTNYTSRKGQELDGAGKAALNLHWKTIGRQLRVRGTISRLDAAQSDAYYLSRPLGSRIGAWASHQSAELTDKSELERAVADAETKHGQSPARPPHWGGYFLDPSEIEFWCAGAFRLHDRFRWTRNHSEDSWVIRRLNP